MPPGLKGYDLACIGRAGEQINVARGSPFGKGLANRNGLPGGGRGHLPHVGLTRACLAPAPAKAEISDRQSAWRQALRTVAQ
eukprot:scaffold1603_cov415-Prasinococcus_capsulatus_cf.AAC.24